MVGERGTTLSGGQRQRIALARAVVRSPDCWCSTTRRARSTRRWRPRSWPACAHRASDAASVVVVAYRKATIALADEVAFIEHGRVIDRGPHAELLARNEGYARSSTPTNARRPSAPPWPPKRTRTHDRRRSPSRAPAAPPRSATGAASRSAPRSGAGCALARDHPRRQDDPALGLVSTLGRIVVPLAVQQTLDGGIEAQGGPDVRRVAILVTVRGGRSSCVTAMTSYVVNVRLFKATEAGLMSLRVKAFRHVHDLSVLTQNSERRGSLV